MAGLSKTGIPYADYGWPLVTGCSNAGPACDHCYAARYAATRGRHLPQYAGLAHRVPTQQECAACYNGNGDWRDCDPCVAADYEPAHGSYAWTGEVRFHRELLDAPLHTKKPGRVFTVPTGDLFHEGVTDEQIVSALDTMNMARQHDFVVVTKRPERMREVVTRYYAWPPEDRLDVMTNVTLLPTVWDQESADRVIPLLLDTPAAVRGISLEPMLGAVDLLMYMPPPGPPDPPGSVRREPFLDWVVLGGETGPGARPMQPEWALDVYRQCKAAGVPFWFKSMGTAPHKKVWDWTNTLGAEMQATNELPAVGQ